MKLLKSNIKQLTSNRLNPHKFSKKKKVQTLYKKRNPTHSGEIYFMHPSHLVPKGEMKKYMKKKGNANPRPVAIIKANHDKTAKVAQIYGTPGNPKNITQKKRIKLHQTNLKKSSWIDTNDKDISEKTKKKFKVGVSPLNKKKGIVHPNDMKRRDKISGINKQKKLT
ncbi:Uncharacterised protein [Acholeplasma oculi]|uniref:Uncharacterized protein n=1 Tax=Acholeplasma oculi TaxID=35623 RepID=A0A061A9V5_9MOLU|nr:hypothetical protein [Acholeplasma oculi]CDR30653.1 hypothetical protein Aocu_05800 [Acholeplasma oculi]SKC34604.1 hypothetical protein SAMN02745122_0006 [Acholeplasma oculi]SKC45728.1 hypothetical protein SAMN02745122_1169 [Acholeplasma oculi]SUT89409.1 Uncharacterised protein [Acholeplasma oculi]SUU69855.1 Uncharacterised protein [Acholeplasma oculi]